jgi:hypothetical protein
MSVWPNWQSTTRRELPRSRQWFAAQYFNEVVELRRRAELKINPANVHMQKDIPFVRDRLRLRRKTI